MRNRKFLLLLVAAALFAAPVRSAGLPPLPDKPGATVKGYVECEGRGVEGVVVSDGFNNDFARLREHPITHIPFKGFQIPMWEEARATVEKIARKAYALPQCHWIGWDLAFLANEEVAIVEGNWRPGTLAQNTHPRGIYHELKELSKKL